MFLKQKFSFFIFTILILILLVVFLVILFLKSDFFKNTISFSGNIKYLSSFFKIEPPPLRIFGKKYLKEPYDAKAIYLTAYTAASSQSLEKIIDLVKNTELNAVVIDIKDYSGKVFYSVKDSKIKNLATQEPILDLDRIISRLHQENIYSIARIVVFQDPALANKRKDLVLKTKKGNIWKDGKGLSWLDPASKEVWDYNLNLARDVANFGFDEINFDYIRFPSDGNLKNVVFPFWDQKISRSEIIKSFFEYLKKNFEKEDFWFSVDIFGMALEAKDDMGIGQIFEDALLNFDIVAPMIYPSHFHQGYNGFKNPAIYPYEVILNSLTKGKERILNNQNIPLEIKNNLSKRIRPWLQYFDLGAIYTPEMIKKEKQAVYDAGFASWYMWNPKNIYNKDAF